MKGLTPQVLPSVNPLPYLLPSNPFMQPDFNERTPIHAYALSHIVYIAHEGLRDIQGNADFPAGMSYPGL